MDPHVTSQRPSGRLAYLDGLRGIAAFLVLIFHFFSAFCSRLIPDQTSTPWMVADTPVALLYNGPFCVIVFFVLSGLVVSSSAAKSKDALAVNLAIRYVRLALPATASILYAWVLLSFMPNEASRAYTVIPHEWLLESYQGAIPSVVRALIAGMVRIFLAQRPFWNNVLWTMRPELVGSCALYAIFSLARARMRLAILLLLAVGLPVAGQTIYEGFVVGGLMSELRSQGKLAARFPFAALAAGVLLGFEGRGFPVRMHLPSLPPAFALGERQSIWYAVGAGLIVYSCLSSPALQAALSARWAGFLGRISFALYLCHVPLLYTFFSRAYMALLPINSLKLAGMLVVFLATSVAIGYLGTIFVDEPVLRLTKTLRESSRRLLAAAGEFAWQPLGGTKAQRLSVVHRRSGPS